MFKFKKSKVIRLCLILHAVPPDAHKAYFRATKKALKDVLTSNGIHEGLMNRIWSVRRVYAKFWPHPDIKALCVECHYKIKLEKDAPWQEFEKFNFLTNLKNGLNESIDGPPIKIEILTDIKIEPEIIQR